MVNFVNVRNVAKVADDIPRSSKIKAPIRLMPSWRETETNEPHTDEYA